MALDRSIPEDLIKHMHTLADQDLRIGQMFERVFWMMRRDHKDPFYLENSEIVSYFETAVKRENERQ